MWLFCSGGDTENEGGNVNNAWGCMGVAHLLPLFVPTPFVPIMKAILPSKANHGLHLGECYASNCMVNIAIVLGDVEPGPDCCVKVVVILQCAKRSLVSFIIAYGGTGIEGRAATDAIVSGHHDIGNV